MVVKTRVLLKFPIDSAYAMRMLSSIQSGLNRCFQIAGMLVST
jgi:hypothetical protein